MSSLMWAWGQFAKHVHAHVHAHAPSIIHPAWSILRWFEFDDPFRTLGCYSDMQMNRNCMRHCLAAGARKAGLWDSFRIFGFLTNLTYNQIQILQTSGGSCFERLLSRFQLPFWPGWKSGDIPVAWKLARKSLRRAPRTFGFRTDLQLSCTSVETSVPLALARVGFCDTSRKLQLCGQWCAAEALQGWFEGYVRPAHKHATGTKF